MYQTTPKIYRSITKKPAMPPCKYLIKTQIVQIIAVTPTNRNIVINSTNINKHVLEDCESQSIEINHISLPNITSNNHLNSYNIATIVKTRNEKARKKKIHKKSRVIGTRNPDSVSSPESLSYEHYSQLKP